MLLEVVDQAARRGNDDVHAGAQDVALLVVVDAAVDQRGLEPGGAADVLEILLDLDREFARRRHDDGARIGRAAFGNGRMGEQALHRCDEEGCGLARTGVQSGDYAGVQVEAVEEGVGKGLGGHGFVSVVTRKLARAAAPGA